MVIQLTSKQFKEIAGELDCGMVCFYNIKTDEIKSYPDTLRYSFDETGNWQDTIDEIDAELSDCIRFDLMSSHDSFGIMADFAEAIPDIRTRNTFIDALEKRKPFQQFKNLLHYYPDLLEQWYAYKQQRLIEYVKEIVEGHNLSQ